MRALLATALLAASWAGCSSEPPPDMLLLGGRVFSADPETPWAEAVAIRGERIIAIGTDDELARLAADGTRVVELAGRVVIPGVNDAHVHLEIWPESALLPLPAPDPTFDVVLGALAEVVADTPPRRWIRGTTGTAVLEDLAATRFALDDVAPDNPVWLGAWTGHGALLNTRALQELEVAADAPDPPGGFFVRATGTQELLGKAHEYAVWGLEARLEARQPDSAAIARYREFAARAARFGITSVQLFASDAARTERLLARADTSIRWRVISLPIPGEDAWPVGGRSAPATAPAHPRVHRSGVKWILDGTPIERLAWLSAPYADRPGWSGRSNFAEEELLPLLGSAVAAGEQPLVHAVGDRTLRHLIEALQSPRLAPLRPRIEHGDMIPLDRLDALVRSGAVVVQNPSHFTFPEVAEARLGPERRAALQPLARLVEHGVPVALGSDGPLNPYLNVMFAVTHPNNPREALSVEQAVLAYTAGSAFAEFAEQEKGRLAPGMLADLCVLSQDIFAVPPGDLPETESVLTLVGGTAAYDAGLLPPR